MRLSKNFTLQEYTKSQTATRRGLDNTPGEEHLAKAKSLFENVVQPVREKFGVTTINSGYRGPALNEAVDIECPGTSNYTVAKFIEDTLDYDQLILEFYTPGIPDSGWVHVSYIGEGNRKQSLTAMKENGKTVYKPGLIE